MSIKTLLILSRVPFDSSPLLDRNYEVKGTQVNLYSNALLDCAKNRQCKTIYFSSATTCREVCVTELATLYSSLSSYSFEFPYLRTFIYCDSKINSSLYLWIRDLISRISYSNNSPIIFGINITSDYVALEINKNSFYTALLSFILYFIKNGHIFDIPDYLISEEEKITDDIILGAMLNTYKTHSTMVIFTGFALYLFSKYPGMFFEPYVGGPYGIAYNGIVQYIREYIIKLIPKILKEFVEVYDIDTTTFLLEERLLLRYLKLTGVEKWNMFGELTW